MKIAVTNNSYSKKIKELEIVLTDAENNAEFVNDKLVPYLTKVYLIDIINNEFYWQKNAKGENIVNVFVDFTKATAGCMTIKRIIKELEAV